MKKLNMNLWERIVFFFSSPEKRAIIAVKKAFDEGTGIEQAMFNLKAEPELVVEEALRWADRTVYTSRTPYGIAVFRGHLRILTAEEDIVREQWLTPFRRDEYPGVGRPELEDSMRQEITTGGGPYLLVTMLRLGDALKESVFAD